MILRVHWNNDSRLGGTRLIRRFVTHPTHDCMVPALNRCVGCAMVCLSKHTWSLFFLCWKLEDMHVHTICFTFKFSIQQKNYQHRLHPLWPCMLLCAQCALCSIELSPHSIVYSLSVFYQTTLLIWHLFTIRTIPKWNTRFDAHFWEHDEHVRKNVPNRHYGSCILPCISSRSLYPYAHALLCAQTLNLALNLFSLSHFLLYFSCIQWRWKIESLFTNAELHSKNERKKSIE